MAFRYRLEILAIVAVLVFAGMFLYASSIMGSGEFTGSDDKGSEQVANITGVPAEEVHPLIPQWIPPGGEVESGLFALQAAAGGIIVGWVFGYWKGLKTKETKNK
jgi:cobalt/nickel transport protein